MPKKNTKQLKYNPPSFECLNCDEAIPGSQEVSLYCTPLCRDEAIYVRYVRACKSDGRVKNKDVQDAIRIRFVHIASGGYSAKERRVSQELRDDVIARDNGRCQICGENGTDIDHIKGNSDKIDNLQLLCCACHNKKTIDSFIPIPPDDERYLKALESGFRLDERIYAKKPLRQCDDEKKWESNWRQILSSRRKTHKEAFHKSVSPLISKLHKSGMSQRKIAKHLNENSIPTYSGRGKWEHKGVGYILMKHPAAKGGPK